MLGDFQSNLDPVVVHVGHQRNGATLLERRSNLAMALAWPSDGVVTRTTHPAYKPNPSHGPSISRVSSLIMD